MTLLQAIYIPPAVRGFESTAPAGAVFDVAWVGEHVTTIEPCAPGTEAQGLLLPTLVDLHLHLDKTHTVHETGAANGDLFRAIEMIAQHRETWTEADLRLRMERGLQASWRSGVRALRTHLDWMGSERPLSVSVLSDLRTQWRDRLDIQWVSLTALDLFDNMTWARGMALQVKSMGGVLGCFIYRNDALKRKLQSVFELAAELDLDMDFHVDEGLDVDAHGLRTIAELTLAHGWQGRVVCGHACSLSVQPIEQARDTLGLLAQADITLTALPTTNLYLQGSWSETPVQRGITRLQEARQMGVRTCIASDNVADPFFPYGCYDPLEAWALGVQMAHLAPAQDWLDTVTVAPAQAMKLAWDGRLAPGCPADFVLLSAHNGFQAMTPAGRHRRIHRQGHWL